MSYLLKRPVTSVSLVLPNSESMFYHCKSSDRNKCKPSYTYMFLWYTYLIYTYIYNLDHLLSPRV